MNKNIKEFLIYFFIIEILFVSGIFVYKKAIKTIFTIDDVNRNSFFQISNSKSNNKLQKAFDSINDNCSTNQYIIQLYEDGYKICKMKGIK